MSLSSASALLVEKGRVVAPASCGGPVVRLALWQCGWGHGRGAFYGWWWFEWVSLGHSAAAHFFPMFGSTYFVVFAGIYLQRHICPLSGSLNIIAGLLSLSATFALLWGHSVAFVVISFITIFSPLLGLLVSATIGSLGFFLHRSTTRPFSLPPCLTIFRRRNCHRVSRYS